MKYTMTIRINSDMFYRSRIVENKLQDYIDLNLHSCTDLFFNIINNFLSGRVDDILFDRADILPNGVGYQDLRLWINGDLCIARIYLIPLEE